MIALGVLVAFIIVLVILFLVGRALVSRDSASAATTAPNTTSATPASSPKSTPKPTPTPSSTVAAGPAAPGIRLWSALQGGECLNGFQNAWQQTYDVTNCTTAHTAQMTLKGVLPIAAGAAYPGDASLQNQVGLVCASSQAISLSAAQAYTGIEVSESYPTSDQWAAGDRTYYCFASRSGGQTLTTSIAAA